MNLLDNIKKERETAILLITHDLALVGENADYISVMYAGRIVENAHAKEFFKRPKHPYSLALLRSLPSNKGSKLATIQGQPPSIQQNISGCRFHPRCELCKELCITKVPLLENIGDEHFCACLAAQPLSTRISLLKVLQFSCLLLRLTGLFFNYS